MTDSNSNHVKHPLIALQEAAEEQQEQEDLEEVHCPECGTTVQKESIEAAVETAESHDDKRHDGEQTAEVNGMLPPSDEVAEAAEGFLDDLDI